MVVNASVLLSNQSGEKDDRVNFTTASTITALCVLAVLDVFVIVANTMIMAAFLRDPKLRVARNYYIFSLALADFISATFVLPLYAHTIPTGDWAIGRVTCVIWNIVEDVCLFSSHMSMLLISYDRYLLVSRAFAYHAFETPHRAALRIGVVWSAGFVLKVVTTLVGEWCYSQTGEDKVSCSPSAVVDIPYIVGNQTYDVISSSISCVIEVFVPLILMIYFNLCVYITIRRKTKRHSVVHNLVSTSFGAPPQLTVDDVIRQRRTSKHNSSLQKGQEQYQTSPKKNPTGNNLKPSNASQISKVPSLDTIHEVAPDTDIGHTPDTDIGHTSDSEVSDEEAQRKIYHRQLSQWLSDSNALKRTLAIIHVRDCMEELSHASSRHSKVKSTPTALIKSAKVHPTDDENVSHGPDRLNDEPESTSQPASLPSTSTYSTCNENEIEEIEQDKCNIQSGGENSLPLPSAVSANVGLKSLGQGREMQTAERYKENTHNKLRIRKKAMHKKRSIAGTENSASKSKQAGSVPPLVRSRSVRFSDPVVTKTNKTRTSRDSNRKLSKLSPAIIPHYKMKLDRKAGITLALLVGCFLCFKVPFATVMMTLAVCRTCISNEVYEVFTWLFSAKVLVNPFLYAFICQRFRTYYVNICKRVTRCSINMN